MRQTTTERSDGPSAEPAPGDRVIARHVIASISPHAARCHYCQRPLTVHERSTGTTCHAEDCRARKLKDNLRHQAEKDEAQRQLAVEHYHEQSEAANAEQSAATSSIDVSPSLPLIGVLPSNECPLQTCAEKRIRRFRERLMRVISVAAAVRYGGAAASLATRAEPDEVSELEPPLEKVVQNACATCRGDCCQQGGDHAFLHPETILRFMKRFPNARPRKILEEYLSRIGPKSYAGSCLYHAEQGCRLPREMRSNICNAFHCKGLSRLLCQASDSPGPQTFVVAFSDGEVTRSAMIRHDLPTDDEATVPETDERAASEPIDNPGRE